MSSMRILIIGNYIEGNGGISGVINNHYKKLNEDGNDAVIFNTKKNSIFRLLMIFILIFKVKQYDIIHSHGSSNMGFFPIVISIIAGKIINRKRTIITYHGGGAAEFLNKHHRFIKIILSKADVVTVMSGFLLKTFSKYNINTSILPNLIDIKIIENININFNVPKLVSIRALETIYNIDAVIKAFSIVEKKYPHSQLRIVGKGNELENLTTLATNLELKNISFLGSMTNEQIPDELSSSNIMISVPSFDNQPMSILEAFACGIPVISSNVGGIPYMIKDGINGLLVELNRPAQIAEKVDWIINHPEQTKEIIANAKYELKQYQWSSIKKQLFEIYQG